MQNSKTVVYFNERVIVSAGTSIEPVYGKEVYLYYVYNEQDKEVARFGINSKNPTRYDLIEEAKNAEKLKAVLNRKPLKQGVSNG
jgi:hypothetical protein